MNAEKLVTNFAVRGALVVGIMLAAALVPANVNRDKTGTNAERSKQQGSQVACGVQLASLGSLQAERGGFCEPLAANLALAGLCDCNPSSRLTLRPITNLHESSRTLRNGQFD